jgi:hypothetical protein
VLVGVTSWGAGCAEPDFPGIWARVSAYAAFLHAHIGSGDPGDFSVSAATTLATLTTGESMSTTISTTATDPAQVLTLSAAGLPSGLTATFAPEAITTGSSSTITLTASSATPPGIYDITVAAAGDVTRSATMTVVVVRAPNLTNAVSVTASGVSFTPSYGRGNADPYVRFKAAPTTRSYTCKSTKPGTSEACTFTAPTAGTYYVMVRGTAAYAGVTLRGSYSS